MTNEEARQTIRSSWRQLIGLMTTEAKTRVNGEESYICPRCGHGEHGDGLTFIDKKGYDRNTLKCFGCGFTGDIIQLYMEYANVGYKEAFLLLANELNLGEIEPYRPDAPQEREKRLQSDFKALGGQNTAQAVKTAGNGDTVDFTAYYGECAARIEDPAAVAYLKKRGISIETAKKYRVGYDPAADPANNPGGAGKSIYPTQRIIIPVNKGYYIPRAIDPECKYPKPNPKGTTPGIFNLKALNDGNKVVFVTEGIFNALSVIEVGAAAIAINSANNAEKLIDNLKVAGTTATLVLCPDADPTGRRANEIIKKGLQDMDISYTEADINCGHKDPNEALTADRAAFITAVRAAEDPGQEPDVIEHFLSVIYSGKYETIPTGIKTFDNAIGGGLLRQTITLVSGAPGVGKTGFVSQIFENMARQGIPSIYYNLEMTEEQLIARSIGRIIYTDSGRDISAMEILQGHKHDAKMKETVIDAANKYRCDIMPHMKYRAISANLDGMIEEMENTAKAAQAAGKAAPMVALDYLQLLNGDVREDAQAVIKRAMKGLKDYARKYKTIVFCISAQSRAANRSKDAMIDAGRDSSAIEYGADLQLQLIRDENINDMINLYITKYRHFPSSKDNKIPLRFHGGQGYFTDAFQNDYAGLQNLETRKI